MTTDIKLSISLLQAIAKRGQKSRRDSHSTGLFHRKNTVNFEASISSWYDDSIPQLPHHQLGMSMN